MQPAWMLAEDTQRPLVFTDGSCFSRQQLKTFSPEYAPE